MLISKSIQCSVVMAEGSSHLETFYSWTELKNHGQTLGHQRENGDICNSVNNKNKVKQFKA